MILAQLYLGIVLTVTPLQEVWNYNNPRPFPKQEYIYINWEDTDFKKVDGEWVLMKKHMYDTSKKAKARKKYWINKNERIYK